MSGYGVPFRIRPLEKVDNIGAPMPRQVREIDNYQTCRVFLDQCSQDARLRAQETNDPRWMQYAKWFDGYKTQQKSSQIYYEGGESKEILQAGCHILELPQDYCHTRSELWSNARNQLFNQLSAYHLWQDPPHTGPGPSIEYQFTTTTHQ